MTRHQFLIRAKHIGFTLIELMIVVTLIGILTAIAVPRYNDYVISSHISSAKNDLMTLSAAIDGFYQQQMTYPTGTVGTTAQIKITLPGWAPTQSDSYFAYSAVITPTGSPVYTLTATGTAKVRGCTLTLTSSNAKTPDTANHSQTTPCGGIWQ